MRKILLTAILLLCVIGSSACSSKIQFPLPKGSKEDASLCPSVVLDEGGRCYKVSMNQHDTMTWFQDTADDKKWTSDWASDVDPFLLYLSKSDEQVKVIFYKWDDDFTGVLLGDVKQIN
ncbi:hypothetical protein [Paenibacillus sp. NPDC058174]|uniref:hypothetical protein n=1 Tax=Paenibacillus sp. NPDC058174 TaxID=3346366 RepID=UPI0036D8C94A